MGMYTEVFFAAEVDEHAYQILREVIDTGSLSGDGHAFFDKPRAALVFRGSSAYFPGANHAIVEVDDWGSGPAARACYVSFRANLKNYDGEIEAFFDWVKPHCVDTNFIGYSMYEEAESPTLQYVIPPGAETDQSDTEQHTTSVLPPGQ